MKDTEPTNGPTQQPVMLLVGSQEFGAYLAGFTEYHDTRARAREARNLRLQIIGEIVEVAALEEILLSPAEILAIADAALEDPEIAGDLTFATFKIILDKQNGEAQ